MAVYALVGVLAGAIAVFEPKWALLMIAAVALLPFLRDRSLALVLLLFAGRFRGFPYAEMLPEAIHASYIAAAFLLFTLMLGHRAPPPERIPDGSALPALAHAGFGAWGLLLWAFSTIGDPWLYSGQKTLEVLLFSSLLLIAPAYGLDGESGIRRVLRWTMTVSLVLLIGSLFTADGSGRLAAFGGGPNVFGRFMGLAAIASLYELQAGPSRLWRWAGGAGVLLFTAGSFLSGSRGASLSLTVVLGLLALYTAWSRRRPGVLLMVGLATAGAVMLLSTTHIAQRFFLLLQADKGLSVMTRVGFAETALEMFAERPWVGWGPGAFAAVVGWPGVKLYPHNLLLELLAEYGAVGTVLFLLMLGSALITFGRYGRPGLLKVTLGGWCGYTLLVTQFSGDLFDSRIVWLAAGLCLALVRRHSSGTEGMVRRADSLPASVLCNTVHAGRDTLLRDGQTVRGAGA